jgi:3-dehydroquinate synthase
MQTVSLSQLTNQLEDYEYFVIDKKVYDLHLASSLIDKTIYLLENPEQEKTLQSFEKICCFFLDKNIKRSDTLVCIGGGATTDLGGYVASSLLRGIEWVSVPTTLLAMIDAAIGGKVGINTSHGKNMIGSFHMPKRELLSSDFLETLDKTQIQSGKGELLKYGFLSKDIFQLIEEKSSLDQIIPACIEYKKDIVEKDFKESGVREILNLGHTFGHAIEKCSEVEHGLAVALGIKMNLMFFSTNLLVMFEKLIESLEISLPEIKVDREEFLEYLKADKKNKSKDKIRFVTVKEASQTNIIDIDLKNLKEQLAEKAYASFFR